MVRYDLTHQPIKFLQMGGDIQSYVEKLQLRMASVTTLSTLVGPKQKFS